MGITPLKVRNFTITYTSSKSSGYRKIFGGERLPATYRTKRDAQLDIAKNPMVFSGRNARVVKFKKNMKSPRRKK